VNEVTFPNNDGIDSSSQSSPGNHIEAQEKMRTLLQEAGGKLYWGELMDATGYNRDQI
jgi:hypothetical protein